MKGIIIEGISTSGKSSVLRHVHKRLQDEMPHSTKLFISEHYTQRMLEHASENNTLNSQMVKRHIDQIIDHLQMYQLMLDESKFTLKPSGAQAFVTIERFLLTFLATQSGRVLKDYSLEDARVQLDKLGKLNITQYIFVLSKNRLRKHIQRTLTHRNDQWVSFIEAKGGLDMMVDESMGWQDNLLSLSESLKEVMPTKRIEITNWDYKKVADTIYNNEYRECSNTMA